MRITLDLAKGLETNAAAHFDRAKKAKRKLEGAREALARQQESYRRAKEKAQKREEEAGMPRRRKEWYEKFRWFFSSEGFLCIGGRDATSNEILIKKHAGPGDLVFHTDMAGSPFFVVKGVQGRTIGEATIEEAAQTTASFSRAWKNGLGFLDVFYVNPEQVTKQARAGEFLGKGSFMITGKTTYRKPAIALAIGLRDGVAMCAAPAAVEAQTKERYRLQQGKEKPSEIAKTLARRWRYDIDELVRSLPPGPLELKPWQ